MFLIQTTLTDFFALASRIEFIVKDYDSVGVNDVLGSILVPKKDLLEGIGERVEYLLNTTKYAQEGGIKIGNKKVRKIFSPFPTMKSRVNRSS